MREAAAGERSRGLTVRDGRRRLVNKADENCGHRHRGLRQEHAAGDGRGGQKKRHRLEEEAAERVHNWAHLVRPYVWDGEIYRTLIALGIREVEWEANYPGLVSRRREEDKQQGDEMVPSKKQRMGRSWQPEIKARASTTSEWWLPFHLILGRLPIHQLFQLRCVCKCWDRMLEAGEVQMDTNVLREEYWFIMSKPPPPYGHKKWKFVAFRSYSDDVQGRKEWASFRPPLPSQSHGMLSSLLGGRHCNRLPKFKLSRYAEFSTPTPTLVSTGGLMCTFVRKPGAAHVFRIIVFNCLTGSVKVLPLPLDTRRLFGQSSARRSWTRFCYIYMAIDDVDPARYYIMLSLALNFQDLTYFEIFDSNVGNWRVGRLPEVATAGCEVAKGDFFHLVDPFDSTATLVAYHAAHDVWSKVEAPKRDTNKFGCTLTFLKWKGRLFQSVTLKVENTLIFLGFVVRELQCGVWVEVARTPQHLWRWVGAEWHAVTEAEGSLFYMVITGRKPARRFHPPLVYDIAQNNWYVLPSERGTTDFGCILVHRPRLSMRMTSLTDSERSSDEALVPLPRLEGKGSFTQDLPV